MRNFFLEPSHILKSYVPFVQNVKFDQGYQTKMQAYENLIPMKCKLCNQYAFAIDLKPQKKESAGREEYKSNFTRSNDIAAGHKKHIILGERVCINCKENKLNEGKQEFAEQNQTDNNDTSSSQKSYIPLKNIDKEHYRELRVRDLSVQELCIGRIIIHNLMILSLWFSDDQEIMYILHGQKNSNNEEYKEFFKKSIQYLFTLTKYDWSTLKKAWCVNDEKVL